MPTATITETRTPVFPHLPHDWANFLSFASAIQEFPRYIGLFPLETLNYSTYSEVNHSQNWRKCSRQTAAGEYQGTKSTSLKDHSSEYAFGLASHNLILSDLYAAEGYDVLLIDILEGKHNEEETLFF
ncbi:hypothetical protein OIDMADRAFT_34701 [Oidiodendron maius Zn]|uniref:Uncharacterized protein n=1 Tax=Oidiodendron maius (strain Zn) TaxID=913774 RepID=A0A0C3C724_OIDMZ|nr:hypothetical protein OIDMADRAFT_34701 [Oidiodendron maius Zn]